MGSKRQIYSFTFTTQLISGSRTSVETAEILVAYFADVGVTMKLDPIQYAAWLSKMTSKTHTKGFLFANDHGNPRAVLRKNFETGETWNPYMLDDEYFNKKLG